MTDFVSGSTSEEWVGCYRQGWGNLLRPEAYTHPAKVSFSLAERIYEHAIGEGWLKPGNTVLDPFGGICGFAFHALANGLSWVGVELEEKFVELGRLNIALWNERFEAMPKWGMATLLQGDSRELLKVVGAADCCVSSPPYAESLNAGASGIDWSKVRGPGNSIRDMTKEAWNAVRPGAGTEMRYSTSPANLGNMPEGKWDAACCISSPPYSESPVAHIESGSESARFQRTGKSARARSGGTLESEQYGTSPGQLANLPAGEFAEACIASPPWEEAISPHGKIGFSEITGNLHRKAGHTSPSETLDGYGSSADNLGNSSGQTFWSAARTILEQTFLALRPGGHAVFVVKSYVRAGKLVDFPAQWAAVCESVGFIPICVHRAMLTRESPPQETINGDVDVKRTVRMSFFRRLHAEKNPHLAILWEDVQCFEKPGTEA